jgi:hypothetical protein
VTNDLVVLKRDIQRNIQGRQKRKQKLLKRLGQKLLENASEDLRDVLLARRLYTGPNAAGQIICILPKLLNPPRSPEAWGLLRSAIGNKLKLNEPEYSPGSGRRRGAKTKKLSDDPVEITRRKYRDRKRRTIIRRHPDTGVDEKIELEPGVSLDPPWRR